MGEFDYIITGAGAAGLSLVYYILQEEELREKSILLVDKEVKNSNDRTWTFWEEIPQPFRQLISKEWDHVSLKDRANDLRISSEATPYNLIRSADFYKFIREELDRHDRVKYLRGEITSIDSTSNGASIVVDGKTYHATQVFNSAFVANSSYDSLKNELIHQRFAGLEVELLGRETNENQITLMDFSIDDSEDVRFLYALPVTSNKIIYNYTEFGTGPADLNKLFLNLEQELNKRFTESGWRTVRREQGVIPMSHLPFERRYSSRILNMGILGGDSRPSTGYTFAKTIENSQKIARALAQGKSVSGLNYNRRQAFYDRVFLTVLRHEPPKLQKALILMFKRNRIDRVFRFLSGKTNLLQELPIILSLPIIPFIRGFFRSFKQAGA